MIARTTQWALVLDRPSVQFVKRGGSYYCVADKPDGVCISYPISIYTHPNTTSRYFGVTWDE